MGDFFRYVGRLIARFFMILGIFFFVMIVSSIIALSVFIKSRGEVPTVKEGSVLQLNINESIVENSSRDEIFREILGQKLTVLDVIALLERAAKDGRIKGLFVKISPNNLSYAQVQELRSAVARFRTSGKPTVAFAESFEEYGQGTKNYYLAAAFEQIFVQPSGMVGITGMAAESPFVKGTLEKVGVVPQGATRKEYKNYWNMFTQDKYTDPHRESTQKLLDSIFERVVEDVAKDRKIAPVVVKAMIDRAPLFPKEAIESKLIDGIKYRDELLAFLTEKTGSSEWLPLVKYAELIEESKAPKETVALIIGEGSIHQGKSDFDPAGRSNSIGSDTVAKAIRDAAKDPEVKAIVLRVDSPGGSVIASEAIWREVLKAKETGKPFIVTMSGVAASGGYYIAMAADKIIAQPSTITGSIGVIYGKFNTEGLWNKLGITFDSVQNGRNARFFSGLTSFNEEQNAKIGTILDEIYTTFVTRAAEGRKTTFDKLEPHAKGRVWSGEDALKLGLVDQLGGYYEAVQAVKASLKVTPETEIAFKIFPKEPNVFDMVLDRAQDGEEEEVNIHYGIASDIADLLRPIAAKKAMLELMNSRQNGAESALPQLELK